MGVEPTVEWGPIPLHLCEVTYVNSCHPSAPTMFSLTEPIRMDVNGGTHRPVSVGDKMLECAAHLPEDIHS